MKSTTEARERLRARLRQGVQAEHEDAPSPYPSPIRGRITKRDGARIRIATELVADVGDLLIVESERDDLLEVVAAEVYAAHRAHGLLDCRQRAPLSDDVVEVRLRKTSLGGRS